MKWTTEWWGIHLIAENEKDEKLLKKLKESLPKDAHSCYKDGTMTEVKEMMWAYKEIDPKYILEFVR